jgi:cysteine desulfurase/selenocysteine lyase
MHDAMHPYQRGGGMVFSADWQSAVYTKMPHRLEAGTPSIAQAIGLATAIYYLEEIITFAWLKDHEASLCASLIDGLMQMPRVTILGPIAQLRKAGHLVSFIIEGVHAHDVAAYLDQYGICVRAGHHCAQPLAQELKIGASIRVSFYAYNTLEEVKTLLKVLNTLLSE